MRRFALLSCVMLLGVSVGPARTPSTPLGTEQRQTFLIQAAVGRGRAEIASGVLVATDGSILTVATTAAIVALGKPLVILDSSRAAFYRVIDERIGGSSGIAYVRIAAQRSFAVAPPGHGIAYAGEPVWIWGHPDTGYWVLSTGTIERSSAGTLRVSCPTCAPGDGGAGVFDGFGRLIGVLNGTLEHSNGVTQGQLLAMGTTIER